MKSLKLFSLLVLIFSLATARAQSDRFSIGPRIGVNFSKVVGDDVDVNANTSAVVGITSTYSITENSGITVDLLYSGEGYEAASNQNIGLNYLRVPVLFNLFVGDLGEAFRPKLYLGLNPGFLLAAENGDSKIEDVYNNFDLGVLGGLGFNYRVYNRMWLNTDFRYARGLTDIVEGDLDGSNNSSLFNQNMQFSLGLAFGLR